MYLYYGIFYGDILFEISNDEINIFLFRKKILENIFNIMLCKSYVFCSFMREKHNIEFDNKLYHEKYRSTNSFRTIYPIPLTAIVFFEV